jgi:hypothetical protein
VIDQRDIGCRIDEEGTSVMHDEDFRILSSVERALANGVALKRWFDSTDSPIVSTWSASSILPMRVSGFMTLSISVTVVKSP